MKRLLALIILSFMIISLVAPFLGANNKTRTTDVAAQEVSTDYKLYAGIAQILHNNYENVKSSNSAIIRERISSGWTTSDINIRRNPDINSEILGVLNFNTYIEYYEENEEWLKIQHNETDAYINKNYVSNLECLYTEYNMPDNNGFKSFMSYTTITDKSSQQYKLQQHYSYTGDYGIREVNNRYCIAIGTAFNTPIGTYVDLILENGTVLKCIVGEIKDDTDTDHNNIMTVDNGCVSEFIVDMGVLDSNIINAGNISKIDVTWDSKVTKLKIYNKNIFNN